MNDKIPTSSNKNSNSKKDISRLVDYYRLRVGKLKLKITRKLRKGKS